MTASVDPVAIGGGIFIACVGLMLLAIVLDVIRRG